MEWVLYPSGFCEVFLVVLKNPCFWGVEDALR